MSLNPLRLCRLPALSRAGEMTFQSEPPSIENLNRLKMNFLNFSGITELLNLLQKLKRSQNQKKNRNWYSNSEPELEIESEP